MKTFTRSLLAGGMALLCLSCTPEDSLLLGTTFEKETSLDPSAIIAIPDVFIPAEEFTGYTAGQIREKLASFQASLDAPEWDKWRVVDPNNQAFSLYVEASPQNVWVIQGEIGQDLIDGEEEVWINCVYLTGRQTEVDLFPDLLSVRFMDPSGENLELEMDLILEGRGDPFEVEWFGEVIPINQFETRLRFALPFSRPSEKEFIPAWARIFISGAIPVEETPSENE